MELEVRDDIKEDKVKPFGIYDKIGYMLGDLGNDLFFGLVTSYLMLFYTDVLGISAGAVGTMLIIARVWDGINDPMMGTFIDRRPVGKHGKFRPYFRYAALPLTAMGILVFTKIPGIPENLKLVYAYVTYIGFGMSYTAMNIPYGSLASVITTDPVERTSLSTFRSIGSLVANLLIMILVPRLVFANGSPTAEGFMKVTAIFFILSNLCYLFAFRFTTERVVSKSKDTKNKQSFKETVKSLSKNRALIGVMLTSLGLLSTSSAVSSLTPYLYKDYFKSPELLSIAGLVILLPSFIILPFISSLVKKFGKKELVIGTLCVAIVAYIVLLISPIKNPYVFMAISFFGALGTGFFNVLVWALVSDAIDYQEYISGKREEAIVYASYSLVRKMGQAIAGGVGGFALTFIGYQVGVSSQTAEVAEGIKNIIVALPLISCTIAVLSIGLVYNLSKGKLEEMTKELDARRG